MRHATTSYAVSLNLAQDRSNRDRQVADAWRRLHAQGDIGPVAASGASRRSVRPFITGLIASLHVRRARSTT